MNYTFVDKDNNEQELYIPDEYIQINSNNLGISTDEVIDMWLYDEGYIGNEEAEALTEKANQIRIDHGIAGKERKSPQREPNMIKQGLIQLFYNVLMGENSFAFYQDYIDFKPQDIEITNKERTIIFKIDNDTYEITLSKKRSKKE